VIDWARPASTIRDLVRAMAPWPRATTHLLRAAGGDAPRLILLETAVAAADEDAPPGRVLAADASGIVVAAGDGTALRIRRLQRAGSKAMDARSFLNGCPISPGDRLGPDGG
jgi:methionyl-tRNA formyltransferase